MTIDITSATRSKSENFISRRASSNVPDMQRSPISEPIVGGIVGIFDVLVGLSIAIWAAYSAGLDLSESRYLVGSIALFGTMLSTAVWFFSGAYKFESLVSLRCSAVLVVRGLFVAISFLIVVSLIIQGAQKSNLDWFALWFVGGAFVLSITRAFMRSQILHWEDAGRLDERIAIIGATTVAHSLISDLVADSRSIDQVGHIKIVGIFDDRKAASRSDQNAKMNVSGDVNDLLNLVRRNCVDTVVIAVPLSDDKRISTYIEKLRCTAVDVRLCPDHVGLTFGQFSVSHLGRHSMLNVMDCPLRHWRKVAKEVEDRVLGLMILVLIAPLMLVIAILIKMDSPGPVLFRQKRLGYNNQLIEVLKFRTMRHDMCDPDAEQQAQRNDPRVTRLGSFLRRTSLDELPQFINVVRGDMSIVGPRPHALATKAGNVIFQDAVESYDARHRMKPGITGWAQVNGWRGETKTVEQIVRRVEHDLFYVDHWSVGLDLKIIARTVITGFTGHSAY